MVDWRPLCLALCFLAWPALAGEAFPGDTGWHARLQDQYERGFRGAAAHRGHTMAYDAATGAWAPDLPDADRDPGELDRAVEERRPALREWHATFDVRGYLEEAGVDARLLRRLAERLVSGR